MKHRAFIKATGLAGIEVEEPIYKGPGALFES